MCIALGVPISISESPKSLVSRVCMGGLDSRVCMARLASRVVLRGPNTAQWIVRGDHNLPEGGGGGGGPSTA